MYIYIYMYMNVYIYICNGIATVRSPMALLDMALLFILLARLGMASAGRGEVRESGAEKSICLFMRACTIGLFRLSNIVAVEPSRGR